MLSLKKSLGQHFLKDENISRRIASALEAISFINLLEIGPGGGALTKFLMELPDVNFKAVELDDEKVEYLRKQHPALENHIIHKSVLDMESPFAGRFAVIGNFPYNISTEILFKLLEWYDQLDGIVGMFQKEVAQRVSAKEGSKIYGVTSVLMQAYFDIEYLFDVSAESFNPPPKVQSGVIRMIPRKNVVEFKNKDAFFKLVKAAFGQRRKTLRNACRNLFDPSILQGAIFDKRAEQIPVEEFGRLSFSMQ